jgi:polar amino acid transport system permease protein
VAPLRWLGARWRTVPRRRRAQLVRWVVYAVTILVLVWLALSLDWERTLFDSDTIREQFDEGIVGIAAKNTIVFTAYAFGGGLAIGLVVALMRLSAIRPYRWFATLYIQVFRGLPALLTIIFIRFGLPLAFDIRFGGQYTAGGVALAIVAGAYIAETIRAGIEAVPKGQTEAARSLGMSPARTMVSIVIPQAFRIIVPPLTNELVLLLKDTSLLSFLGTTEATEELTQFARNNTIEGANPTPIVVAGLMYLAITIPLTQIAALLERRGKRAR